ncbi:BLUF domain-containing protein [Thalassotalea euphylliae]|uniref:BLUF domain-containing protein n=1 Tax=Thalassotalea euphylliae TaxID=1655234 RepID=UPI00363C5B63
MKSIVYISKACQQFSQEDLNRLAQKAMEKNGQLDVTGFLSLHDDRFIQYIEGDENTVEALFQTIRLDERHKVIKTLSKPLANGRNFPKWRMKHISSSVYRELSVETFILKQLEMMQDCTMDGPAWHEMIWQGIDILADKADTIN